MFGEMRRSALLLMGLASAIRSAAGDKGSW